MKETENPFYEDSNLPETDEELLHKENFIQALLLEETFADEVSLSPEEDLQTLPSELSERTLLKRTCEKWHLHVWKLPQEQRMIFKKLSGLGIRKMQTVNAGSDITK